MIDDVITVMRALDAALPDDDRLKWFNRLYLRVTERVTTIQEAVEAQVGQECATGVIRGEATRFRLEMERSYRERDHESFGTLYRQVLKKSAPQYCVDSSCSPDAVGG